MPVVAKHPEIHVALFCVRCGQEFVELIEPQPAGHPTLAVIPCPYCPRSAAIADNGEFISTGHAIYTYPDDPQQPNR